MKEKILTFIIGFLVGAIMATLGFLIYTKNVANDLKKPEMNEMNGNVQMGGEQGGMEQPPEKPDGNNSVEPPEKPEEKDNINNN